MERKTHVLWTHRQQSDVLYALAALLLAMAFEGSHNQPVPFCVCSFSWCLPSVEADTKSSGIAEQKRRRAFENRPARKAAECSMPNTSMLVSVNPATTRLSPMRENFLRWTAFLVGTEPLVSQFTQPVLRFANTIRIMGTTLSGH